MMVYKKRYMSAGVMKTTLGRILRAPVNLFFDITPIGKIMKIFNEDINVFQHQILPPITHSIDKLSHFAVVFYMMWLISVSELLIGLVVVAILVRIVSKPYLYADNQLHKIGRNLWEPIHSYFYESMRGTSIIRAFGQEQVIMKK